MLLLLFLSMYSCLIKKLENDIPIKYVNNLLAKTVVLIELELLYRRNDFELWELIPDHDQSGTNLDIFISKENDWKNINENGKIVAEYERSGAKNSYFFTASDNKYYLYEITLKTKNLVGQYAIRSKIYEGRQKDPRIVSQADTQIRELSKQIEHSIVYTKQIGDVQKLDALDDLEYKKIIGSIFRIVIWVVILKIAVFYCMFYTFNRKLKEFYVTKKIVAK